MREAGVERLPSVRRVVLVGNKLSPGNPAAKPDGTQVHTLWGELAWQLGGAEAFHRVRADDERARVEDVEVGGQRGREALERLRNVVSRVESSWRPATAEEGFEIVRRRLFEPLADPARFKDRDVVSRAFADLYRTQHQEFPPECRDADYEKRIRAAYPIHLGCVLPGETPAVFGDALRRLVAAATYLYQDGPRYWYSTQPTVTKLAEDRAERLRREPDRAEQELGARLREDLRATGDFGRVHPLPQSGQDVPDEPDARLVVLGSGQPYARGEDNPAQAAARGLLESRGHAPRSYRNALVFLAADRTRMQDLDEAVRRYLAWESIFDEREQLDLSPHQVRQVEVQREAASGVVTARLPETCQWLLAPVQATPQDPVTWQEVRLSGSDALAVRASKRLRNDELLVTSLGATRLRMELDRAPLWRGDHVTVKQLVEDFASYPYLPRLRDPKVLLAAVTDGVALLSWQQDAFAFAEGYDDEARRYRGLRAGQLVALPDADAPGMLVKPEVARRQLDAEKAAATDERPDAGQSSGQATDDVGTDTDAPNAGSDTRAGAPPKRFHGTVPLDAARVGRDAGRIAEEVISHLAGLVGAEIRVTLDVEATIPDGAPENVVRTVTENSRTLKFTSQGFERE